MNKFYSAAQKKRYEYCFLKQKFQLQMDIAQYENAATPALFHSKTDFTFLL